VSAAVKATYQPVTLPKDLEFRCPHCQRDAHTRPLIGLSTGPQRFDGPDRRGERLRVHAIVQCPCGEVSYAEAVFETEGVRDSFVHIVGRGSCLQVDDGIQFRVIGQFPPEETRRVPDSVPVSVAADALEAARCRSAAALKATCTMARRTLQNAAYDKGAPRSSDKSYADRIAHLKNATEMTDEDETDALLIKNLGDDGAHPAKWDPEVEAALVTEADADFALDVLWRILETIYTIPSKRDAMTQRRQDLKARDQAANPNRPKKT
jgi:hypothetical protein